MAEKRNPKAVQVDEEIIDFSEVRPFEPLDSSVMYLCQVSGLENKESKSGKPMVVAELTILKPAEVKVEEWEENEDGDLVFVGLSDKTAKAAGRKLFRNYMKEPQALPFLHQFLKACDPNVELNEAFRFRPAEWIGMELAVRGQNQAYQEQVRLSPSKMYPKDKFKS